MLQQGGDCIEQAPGGCLGVVAVSLLHGVVVHDHVAVPVVSNHQIVPRLRTFLCGDKLAEGL